MIRKLAALFRDPEVQVPLVFVVVSFGVTKLQALIAERRETIEALDYMIAERAARLLQVKTELGAAMGAEAAAYPAPGDVDPLDRAVGQEDVPAGVGG